MSSPLTRRGLSTNSPSVYRTIQEHEQTHLGTGQTIESGQSVDERNLDEHFQDQDLEDIADSESQTTTESVAFLPRQTPPSRPADGRGRRLPRWMLDRRDAAPNGDGQEDDVPESLLLEVRGHTPQRGNKRADSNAARGTLPDPVPGPVRGNTKIQWNTQRAQQQLYQDQGASTTPRNNIPPSMSASGYLAATAQQKAMWMWMNVTNLDNFLAEVYGYYTRKGMWSITLSALLDLARIAFLVSLTVILVYCIDYSKVPKSKKLSEIWISGGTKEMSFVPSTLLFAIVVYWIIQLASVIMELRHLSQLRDFFTYLLDINDEEIQTISWQEVVGRLMVLRNDNPRTAVIKLSSGAARFMGDNSKDRMDAHDIANRIMRKDNYLIALFNKELLDVSLPIPFLGNRQFYSNNLEWNIKMCILDYVFNERGQVQQLFLKDVERQALIDGLNQRFRFFGVFGLVQAPFLVVYSLLDYFFRYFKEFQSNPSQLGARAYAPMAEWKFREFNELYHFFRRRADMSVPFAARYLEQFPKNKTVQISSFVAFVSGALLALLAMVSLLDPSNFLNFELSENRTVLFYLGVLTVIWSVSKGIVPEDNEVFDPEYAIQEVINYTHYCPNHWKGRLHSDDVRKEFSILFPMKIMIFLEEVLSLIVTPIILCYKMPSCSDRIVDFFREFTVHVDGLGYVCSFALFEFQKGAGTGTTSKHRVAGDNSGLRDDYYASNDNKMLASYYSFIDNYGANASKRNSHRSPRQRFHPPPTFPGISSPLAERVSSQNRDRVTIQTSDLGRSTQRLQMEPSASFLLDPNHQPPPAMARRMHNKARGHSLHPLRESTRLEEDGIGGGHDVDELPIKNMAASVVLEEDSRLGGSWKVAGAGAMDDDDEDDEDGPGGEGVLNLLMQFQQQQRRKSVGV